jgi:hypothetical protein
MKNLELLQKNYMRRCVLSKPISIRFSDETDSKLGRLADRNGIKKAELIRICVEKFLDEVERTGKIEVTQTILSDAPAPKARAAS